MESIDHKRLPLTLSTKELPLAATLLREQAAGIQNDVGVTWARTHVTGTASVVLEHSVRRVDDFVRTQAESFFRVSFPRPSSNPEVWARLADDWHDIVAGEYARVWVPGAPKPARYFAALYTVVLPADAANGNPAVAGSVTALAADRVSAGELENEVLIVVSALLLLFTQFVRESVWGIRVNDAVMKQAARIEAYERLSWASQFQTADQKRQELENLMRTWQVTYAGAYGAAPSPVVRVKSISVSCQQSRPHLAAALDLIGLERAQRATSMDVADRDTFERLVDAVLEAEQRDGAKKKKKAKGDQTQSAIAAATANAGRGAAIEDKDGRKKGKGGKPEQRMSAEEYAKFKQRMSCFNCGEKGHFKADCPFTGCPRCKALDHGLSFHLSDLLPAGALKGSKLKASEGGKGKEEAGADGDVSE